MRTLGRLGSMVLAAGLAGCVLPPPPPPPLVALPGPGKTEAQFQVDDTGCRASADATPPGGTTIEVPAAPAAAQASPSTSPAPQTMQTVQATPGMVYLRCMTAHNNMVEPLAPRPPVYYGFYAPYPVYYGFGDVYPWLYGDAVGFGFYGGWGYGGRWGGGYWGGGGRWAGGRGGFGWRR